MVSLVSQLRPCQHYVFIYCLYFKNILWDRARRKAATCWEAPGDASRAAVVTSVMTHGHRWRTTHTVPTDGDFMVGE